MPEHISRKELKQDKIHDAIEHGAEAVFSHTTVIGGAVLLVIVLGAIYAGWRFYMDRQTVQATAAMDLAMKTFGARIAATPDPSDPGEPFFPTEAARAEAAVQQFSDVARKFSRTDPGRHAAYYAALCNEDLERHNQALEQLQKISAGSDKELAAMAQYQIGLIDERAGKTADAIKIFRDLSNRSSIFVPRPLALLELAGALRQTNPAEAASVYEQLKKEFPNSAAADQADRGLETLAPKS